MCCILVAQDKAALNPAAISKQCLHLKVCNFCLHIFFVTVLFPTFPVYLYDLHILYICCF